MTKLPQVFEKYRTEIDAELRSLLAQHQSPLYDMMRYQMGWVDQQRTPQPKPDDLRLHSTLCLLVCEAMGGDFETALPAAAALDLVHTFTQVHEDVQNGNPPGEDRRSVWWVWGPGQAINVGDGLHALGRTSLFRLADRGLAPERVIQCLALLDEACIKMCEGQYLDLSHQERIDLSVDGYLKMAEAKSGALMGCATELGVLAATEDPGPVEALGSWGRNMGIAFQIKGDIDDFWGTDTGSNASPKVLNKKKAFPVVELLERSDIGTKRRLGTIYFKRVLEPSDVEELRTILEENKAREKAQEVARGYFRKAMDSLEGLDLSEWGLGQLEEVGQYMAGSQ